jgi:hypothetical protein
MTYSDNSVLGASLGELAAWEDHPVSKRFREWLQNRLDYHRRSVEDLLVRDDGRAKGAAGAVLAYREVIAAMDERPLERLPDVEETFTDPAARKR